MIGGERAQHREDNCQSVVVVKWIFLKANDCLMFWRGVVCAFIWILLLLLPLWMWWWQKGNTGKTRARQFSDSSFLAAIQSGEFWTHSLTHRTTTAERKAKQSKAIGEREREENVFCAARRQNNNWRKLLFRIDREKEGERERKGKREGERGFKRKRHSTFKSN